MPLNEKFLKHLPSCPECRAVIAYLDWDSGMMLWVHRHRTNAPFRPPALIKPLMELAENRDTEYLDQLAHQLKIDKTPACRRAINRILAEMKRHREKSEYDSPMAAESAFRKFVQVERACQKTNPAVDLG
jgi:hypothetical protein